MNIKQCRDVRALNGEGVTLLPQSQAHLKEECWHPSSSLTTNFCGFGFILNASI